MNKRIEKGTIIELNDEQSLRELMDQKKGVDNGRRLMPTTINTYEVAKDPDIVLQEVNTSPGTSKIVSIEIPNEEVQEYYIGEAPDWFYPATLEKVLDRGDTFVFEEPENTKDFDVDELVPAQSFVLDDSEVYEQVNEFVTEYRSTVISFTFWKHTTSEDYIFMVWSGVGATSSVEVFEARALNSVDVNVL